MRCSITNHKTLERLSERVGARVVQAMTRGNTGHRVDCRTEDGKWWMVWPNGSVVRDEQQERAWSG